MSLYQYSLVRCVPAPRTGEFINIGAIAGSTESDDWEVRQISNERRAARICSKTQLASVHEFLASIAEKINESEADLDPIPGDWLSSLHSEMRNVVQLSVPQPAAGQSASEILDTIFDRMLIEPESTPRGYVGKATLLASLRRAFASKLASNTVMERPEVHVGQHLRTNLDFAVGAKSTVQITQAWSFQKGTVEDVATEVKSWGYALSRLREGEQARVISKNGDVATIDSDVKIDVLMASPQTAKQQDVFEEAKEVFDGLKATVYQDDAADVVGDHARELVGA